LSAVLRAIETGLRERMFVETARASFPLLRGVFSEKSSRILMTVPGDPGQKDVKDV
jgi:hypothetical protein